MKGRDLLACRRSYSCVFDRSLRGIVCLGSNLLGCLLQSLLQVLAYHEEARSWLIFSFGWFWVAFITMIVLIIQNRLRSLHNLSVVKGIEKSNLWRVSSRRLHWATQAINIVSVSSLMDSWSRGTIHCNCSASSSGSTHFRLALVMGFIDAYLFTLLIPRRPHHIWSTYVIFTLHN